MSVYVAGVGMTKFYRPSEGQRYEQLAAAAIRDSLADAGLDYRSVEEAYAAYVYGDSASGQHALYQVGLTGIPVVNTNNNCASGSTALFLAARAVMSGARDCVLAVGFEQMRPGAIGATFPDHADPLAPFVAIADGIEGTSSAPMAARLFGAAGREHRRLHGTSVQSFAKIAVKARRHAQHNARAVFRSPVSLEDVLAAPMIYDPLTRLQCCPPTSGAAAAILVSERLARSLGKAGVRLAAIALTTDQPMSFHSGSAIMAVGADVAARAARQAYEAAAVGPSELDVAELHDCFTANELLSYEALGLCEPGGAERFIVDDANTYGGTIVVNPSGGLLSKGHPLGATGLAQAFELAIQLRGQAGARQVDEPRLALQHNIGLGGACVVAIYERCQ